MAERRDDGVDPRFDPVFQRGYDPERHGAGRTSRAQRARPEPPQPDAARADAVRIDPRAEERSQATRLHAAPAAASSAETAPSRAAAVPSSLPPVESDEPGDGDSAPSRRNPFRLALLLASLAALAAAVVLLWSRFAADPQDYYYGSNAGKLFQQQLVETLPGPLLIAGLAGLIAWLALGALAAAPSPGGTGEGDDG